MKKSILFLILLLASLSSSAQKLTKTDNLFFMKGQTNIQLNFDYTKTVYDKKTLSDFLDDECKDEKEKKEIKESLSNNTQSILYQNFKNGLEKGFKKNDNPMRIRPNESSQYMITINILSLDKKLNVKGDAVITDKNSGTIKAVIHFVGKSWKFGTPMQLLSDAYIDAGLKLGNFISKNEGKIIAV
jgi:hypothetical protein